MIWKATENLGFFGIATLPASNAVFFNVKKMPFGFPAFIKEIFKNLTMASKMFLFLLLFLFISKQVCILADLSILNRFLKEIIIAKWFLGFLFLLNPWRPLPSSESFPWETDGLVLSEEMAYNPQLSDNRGLI